MNIPDFTVFFKRLRYSVLDPVRDWLVLLTLSIIAFISIVVWNAWAFDTVANGGTIGATAPTAATSFDPASLNAIHEIFEDRAGEAGKYMNGMYRFADPSQ
jgi:hypothetical protein